MGDPISQLLGLILIRVILAGAVLVTVWLLWNGLYMLAAGLILALAYFLYISWRPVTVEDELIDPEYWDR